MKNLLPVFWLCALSLTANAEEWGASTSATPYADEQKVVLQFFFNHPSKLNVGLDWLRVYLNTLIDQPYNLAPEFLDIKVIMHGAEIVALTRQQGEKYRAARERIGYYASLGVDFRICEQYAQHLHYRPEDFPAFVTLVPSGPNELVHWQNQGYALLIPQVQDKLLSDEQLRRAD